MAENSTTGGLRGLVMKYAKRADILLTAGIFGTIFLLILPVPTALMDVLLAASIGVALLILLTVLYVKHPPEFAIFPTILLAVTLYRLGLNVATTRLILLDGYAGDVINTFGNFVVRGNYVVGIVVFMILVVINFMVITKGSGRIAEVAARFTLDAMPGKQMSIDAELNAGTITEIQAQERREKIQKEADFYGSMDGASKFVRGDAMAGILITLINIVGGILIGVFQRGMAVDDAMSKYTLLSIGDGLVSQIPALIISVGAGLLITRSNDSSDMGSSFGEQFTKYPQAINSLAVLLGIFAVMPGMPFVPFMLLSAGAGGLGWALKKRLMGENLTDGRGKALPAGQGKSGAPGGKLPAGAAAGGDSAAGGAAPNAPALSPEQDFANVVHVDSFAIELGYGLLTLADKRKDGDLIERITGVRRTFAREVGMIVPPIAVRDNLELDTNEYRFLLRNKEVARSSLMPNRWLAMNVGGSKAKLKGIATVEPVFGLDAVWVMEDEKRNAEVHGFTVVDPSSVLITHLSECLREQSANLLEREDTQKLIDMVKEKNPTLVSELLPDLVNVGLIQRVLQNLLREKLPIKNLTLILETIADFASVTKNVDDLSEQVRRRLGMYFVPDYESAPNTVQCLTLDPRLEQNLSQRVKRTQFEIGLILDPNTAQHMIEQLRMRVDEMVNQGLVPLIVTTAELRLAFKRFFDPSFPRLVVLAYQEIPNQVQLQNIGIISAPIENQTLRGQAAA